MDEREVIVVGAGPTGSATAIALAQRGRDVLLLDRQQFPRDKACGDGIPASAVDLLYALGLKEKFQAANFYPVRKLSVFSPRGLRLSADLHSSDSGAEAHVIPRMQFDALVQEHAVASGVDFQQGQVKEPLLDGDGRVVGVRARLNGQWQELRSRVVIAADGVTSTISRALRSDNAHQDGHRAIALRAYIEDIAELPHEVEFYLYKAILPGYAWIFPLGEGRANIGLGMRLDHFRGMKQNLEEMLQAFLRMTGVQERLRDGGQLKDIATWQLNFGSQKKLQHAFDGALLAGDAAGFINPLTGGGIHNGLLSAKIAAEVVDDALRRGDLSQRSLQLYERLCDEAMAKDMNKAYFLQRLLHHFPFIVDLIVRWAGKNSSLAQTFVQKL